MYIHGQKLEENMEKLKQNLGYISYNVRAINKNWEGEKGYNFKTSSIPDSNYK